MLRMPSVIIFFYCGFSNYEYRQHIFLPDLTAFSYKDNVLFSLNFNVICLVCFSLFALNIKHSIKTMNGLVVNFFRETKIIIMLKKDLTPYSSRMPVKKSVSSLIEVENWEPSSSEGKEIMLSRSSKTTKDGA